MKTIKREDLNEAYKDAVKDDCNLWPEKYEHHGCLVECNFGGKIVTISNNGEAVFVVSDWSGEAIVINGVFEVDFFEDAEDMDLSGDGFKIGETVYMLNEFMKM